MSTNILLIIYIQQLTLITSRFVLIFIYCRTLFIGNQREIIGWYDRWSLHI